MIIAVLLVLLGLLVLVRTWWYSCDGWLHFDNSIPSPPVPSLIFGHSRAVNPTMYGEAGIAYFIKWGLRHPKLLKFRLGCVYALTTSHPVYIKALLSGRQEKHWQYDLVRNWLGDGLLFSTGDKWYSRRKLLTPSFHFDILTSYTGIFNETTDVMVEQLRKSNGEAVEIFPKAISLTLDTILRSLLSYESNCQSQNNYYAELMLSLCKITIERMNNPEKMIDWIFFLTKTGREYLKLRKKFRTIGHEIITRRRQEHKSNPTLLDDVKNLNFLDVLLSLKYEDGTRFTDEDVLEEVNVFTFAGHDTTASAISWTLYQLCQHPQHMDRCYQEIADVFNAEGFGKHVTQQDLNSLTYFSMCIKECLRLTPPIPYIGRSLAKDVTVEGHFVPKGSTITVMINALHRSEEYWDEPEEFNPDRFSADNSRGREPYSYLPFGVGNRNCIGQNFALLELKMTVAKIIYYFDVKVVAPENVARLCTIIQKPEHLFLRFQQRKK